MELKSRIFSLKLAFFGCFPTLSVLLVVLGVGRLRDFWAVSGASALFFVLGLLLGKIVQKHRSLSSSGAPVTFCLLAWAGALILSAEAGRSPLVLGLGVLVSLFAFDVAKYLLKRYNLLDRLNDHQTCVWLIFTISAAVPASIGLDQLNHLMSILPIIIYGVVFGWFGPEVIARVVPGMSRPAFLMLGFFFIILSLYGLLETFNPALKYLTPDWVIVVFLSYLACHTMLVSRCISEAVRTSQSDNSI